MSATQINTARFQGIYAGAHARNTPLSEVLNHNGVNEA